jgi:hypothetical protein
MDASEERALRDALELAQARAVELEHAMEAVTADCEAQLDEFEEYIERLQQAFKREVDAREEAVALVEELQQQLEAHDQHLTHPVPGEQRQIVKLKAEIVALKVMRDRATHEHEQALDTIEALKRELAKSKKK